MQLAVFAAFGLAAIALAMTGLWGWNGWFTGGVLLGLALGKAIALARGRTVARLDASGVTLCLPTGREMHARWGEIQAHTIGPDKALGGLIVGTSSSDNVRILPIALRDIGPDAAAKFLAALKARLPKLDCRVPRIGRGK